jgi:hypothetical protein
MKMKS